MTESVFQEYARYYNLLYRDKDYRGETDFIHNIISRTVPEARAILDLGCGAGEHARFFSQKGFVVQGVDCSAAMLRVARAKPVPENVSFSEGDIRRLRLNRTFDVVVALFHVVCYQTTNDDLWKTIQTAYRHLSPGGVFIFDFWYGPAVLTEGPAVRIKRVNDPAYDIIRIAEPRLNPEQNTVTVNYQLFVKDKQENSLREITESHLIRYLFRPELVFMLTQAGFRTVDWLTFPEDTAGWTRWLVARK